MLPMRSKDGASFAGLAGGAPGVHFYTLNKAPATRAILGALKASRPWERAPVEAASAG